MRFPFDASAEVFLENPAGKIPARVTELSFRGCFLEMSADVKEKQRLRVKIFYADEYFEAGTEVMYVRQNGAGVLFLSMEPHFRGLLQAWILKLLDEQSKTERS